MQNMVNVMDKSIINENTPIEVSRFNRIMPDTKNKDLKIDIIWNNISYANNNVFNTVSHIHSFYEVYCVLDGTIRIKLKNKEITLKKDDCILYPPKYEHQILDYSEDFARYDVGFRVSSESLITSVKFDVNSDDYRFAMTSEMKNQFSYMIKYANSNNPYSSYAIGNALCAFVIDVLSHIYLNNKDDEKNKLTYQYQSSLAYAAKEFVQDNYERQITPDDLAEVLHISTRQLSRVLKKYYNIGFSDLLENVRIEKAKKYLENTTLSVEEISYKIGYTNQYTFIRAFNRVVGVTPGKYKEN